MKKYNSYLKVAGRSLQDWNVPKGSHNKQEQVVKNRIDI